MNLYFLVPEGIDDPAAPSGGNAYDRRVSRSLAGLGFQVVKLADPAALAGLPDGAAVLVDGLIAVAIPEMLAAQADRLRLVILVHMLFGDAEPSLRGAEARAFSAAKALVTTSRWCRGRLLELYPVPAERVYVATPGAGPAPVAEASPAGSRLLCVAALAPHKGHDLLIEALAGLRDLAWTCTCAGSLARDAGFAARIALRAKETGIDDRVSFPGPLAGAGLEAAYASADLLVVPSRGESYGMVVTEALARGVPVLATEAGGLPEALGRSPRGLMPGLLIPPGDAAALAAALRRWLEREPVRRRLRLAAYDRRATLTGWDATARHLAAALPAATGGTACPAP